MTSPPLFANDDDSPTPQAQTAASFRESEDWRWLVTSPQGARIVRDILTWAGLFQTTLRPTAHEAAAAEGRKQVAYWLTHKVMAADPAAFAQILIGENQ